MKTTNFNIFSLFTSSILLLFGWQTAIAQEVVSQVEIQGGAFNGSSDYMVRDDQGNYYVGLEYGTSRDSIVVGGVTVKSHRNDPIFNGLSLSDFYFLRFDRDHILTGGFVIDNAEDVNDFYSSGDHSFLAMNLYKENGPQDTLYPITIGGEVIIDRESHRGKGVLVILDEELNFEKTIIPASCKIGEVAAESDYVYMELRIPNYEPYITIEQDTVFNHTYTGMPDNYGRQTVVICKYDYKNEEVVWLLRIGNVGYEELKGIDIDQDHNLIIRGTTTSTNFTFDGINYVVNSSSDNPFVAKYSPDGVFLVGMLNTNEVSELSHGLITDNEGNFYRISDYYGPTYEIGDTILYNTWLGNRYTRRGIIIKHDSDGNFKWIRQLEGEFEISWFQSVVINDEQTLIISGLFRNGDMIMEGESYHHENSDGDENTFLWILDSGSGTYKNHIMSQGPNARTFYNMSYDHDGLMNLFMRFGGNDTIFNEPFSSYLGFTSGYLVKLDMDFIALLDDSHQTHKKYKVYPNPVSYGENINVKTEDRGEDSRINYRIFDQLGVLIRSSTAETCDSLFIIPTNNLTRGAYWIFIRDASSFEVQLVIVN